MSCPNCGTEMNTINVDNQIVLHCHECGGSFFEENNINRISSQSAFQLFQDKNSDEVSGQTKLCPKDKTQLISMQNTESIPPEVTLLKCSKCNGIFTFPEDLVKFKKAQEVKVSFFKTWRIPLPSLRSVAVLSFVAFVAAGVFSRYIFFQSTTLSKSNASDIIKNIDFSISGRFAFVSFKTQFPVSSTIIITNLKTKESITKQVSTKLTTLHYTTTNDIDPSESYSYHLILTDEKGKKLITEEKKLEIK